MDTARKLLDEVVEEFERLAPKAIERLEAGFEDAIMALPEGIRRRLRTTNAVERLNREIRRRERVIGIFPNEESALRLIGAVLVEIDESWTTGNKYLDMTEYLLQRNKQEEAESYFLHYPQLKLHRREISRKKQNQWEKANLKYAA